MLFKLFTDKGRATLHRNDRRVAIATLQRCYWLAECKLCNNLRRNGMSKERAIGLIVEHYIRHHDGRAHESNEYGK